MISLEMAQGISNEARKAAANYLLIKGEAAQRSIINQIDYLTQSELLIEGSMEIPEHNWQRLENLCLLLMQFDGIEVDQFLFQFLNRYLEKATITKQIEPLQSQQKPQFWRVDAETVAIATLLGVMTAEWRPINAVSHPALRLQDRQPARQEVRQLFLRRYPMFTEAKLANMTYILVYSGLATPDELLILLTRRPDKNQWARGIGLVAWLYARLFRNAEASFYLELAIEQATDPWLTYLLVDELISLN